MGPFRLLRRFRPTNINLGKNLKSHIRYGHDEYLIMDGLAYIFIYIYIAHMLNF